MTKARDLADFVSAGNPLADGTIDVADINGITATTAELNYTDGVTSNIQTQLDAKVAKAGDSMIGDLSFGDNDKAIFGAGSDLQIFHDSDASSGEGSVGSYIKEGGTGDLRIRASNLQLQSSGGERYMTGTENGAAVLFYDDASKLATTSTGINVTGTITADAMNLTGNLDMGDNDVIRLGDGDDLQIYHNGSNSYVRDAGTGGLVLQADSTIFLQNNGGTENYATFNQNSAVNLYYDNALKLATTSYGVSVTGSAVASTQTWTTTSTSVLADFNIYQNFVWTLDRNITLANPSTEKLGQSGFFVFIHSGAGRTVSLGTDYETAGGAGLTLSGTSGATDIVPYIVAASGRILLGTPQLAFS